MDLINGNGYDEADLMFVADYCRKADETSKLCLSGYYSRKLEEYLQDTGVSLHQCYKTCVFKLYEKGLGVGTWGQDKKILATSFELYCLPADYWENILIGELNSVCPKVIVAMGEYALQMLTGKRGITNFRGSVLPLSANMQRRLNGNARGAKVVVTQHPIIEHTQEEQKFLIRMDIGKAIDLVFNPTKKLNDYEITVARTTNDYIKFQQKYMHPDTKAWMTTDIETHMDFITCASFTYDGKRGMCIPLVGSSVPLLEKCRMQWFLAKDLENLNIAKNNQNIGYDKRRYQRYGYRVNPVKWDTQLAASVIAAEFPKRLGFLTSIYCDGAYHKDEGKEFDPTKNSFDQLYEYCAKDSITTHQIMLKQREELVELNALDFFEDLMMRWFNVYYDMESIGVLCDQEKRADLNAKYEGLRSLKIIELNALTGTPLKNLAYGAVGDFMEHNEFPVLRHRVDSGYMIVNTDAESLKKMRSMPPIDYKRCNLPYEHAIRFINLVLLIRRIDKIIEYINTALHWDGRIRCSVNLGGTSSGRTANRATSDQAMVWVPATPTFSKQYLAREGVEIEQMLDFENLGRSFQTVTKHGFIVEGDDDEEIDGGVIGKDVREMYVPDKGYLLIEVDRSQAEARVVDLLAEDYEGLEEYGKIDKHSKNASIIFPQYDWQTIRKMYKEGNDEGAFMRQIGKKAVHATNYDMGDFRLSNLANISIQFAHQCLTAIHRAKPWIKQVFHHQVAEAVRNTRRMDNPLGRPRMFYKKLDAHGIKVAYSWYPQSTISDSTKLALLKVVNEMDRAKAWIFAENHDSISAIVHPSYARTYIKLVRKHLTEPIDFRKGTFYRDYQLVIPVDVSISRHNWGAMKELKRLKAA